MTSTNAPYRPLVVDAGRIGLLVADGTFADRMKAVIARMTSPPVEDLGGYLLSERGYAYGQVRCFSIAIFAAHAPDPTAPPPERVAATCRRLLDPSVRIMTDDAEIATAHARVAQARRTLGVIGREWSHEGAGRFWGYEESPHDGRVTLRPNGRMDMPDHPFIPQPVVDRVFDGVPMVHHLVPQGGNRKWNIRYGTDSDERMEIDCGAEDDGFDPLERMRIIAANAHLLPRRAA